ncbi:MAG: methylenetetrahydrofolate--tRNA-(uracil(54)-C(5))-methyltransferase (FADH(2)-oxidizing) TrmFO [Clostridia bacterium]|nr:methylenetetrahydrofolate--tRNA-(uracil(54)-C(5))-methyltransferase (FADH(2)-oxidizing) TrmFO [Clostridia bacterium]
MQKVKVIGAGLAGCESAYYLAKHGIEVELFDIKPNNFTPAHKSNNFAELVCSNSLKSNDIYGNAAGLLKEEMRMLGSLVIESADKNCVPAGGALAVNRETFSSYITEKIKSCKNINFISEEIKNIYFDEYTIIATGPLTTENLSNEIVKIVGGELSFYDASAPIISFDSIDMDNAFFGDRYGKGNGDHINCPLNEDEYKLFIQELLSAEKIELHGFENSEVFEGCMPIEVMATRGNDTLRYGPLKPVGLDDPKTGRWPYACLQLRREDEQGSMFNLVGFQTNLKWGEQKRVFSIIPALKNAEYLRYGVMHKNTFINSPKVLDKDYSLIEHDKIFFAGQITGVEGYVESAMSGLMSAIYLERKIKGKKKVLISDYTVSGSLAKYITTENADFEPMNANFGVLRPLDSIIKDKSEPGVNPEKENLKDQKDSSGVIPNNQKVNPTEKPKINVENTLLNL